MAQGMISFPDVIPRAGSSRAHYTAPEAAGNPSNYAIPDAHGHGKVADKR
jgi:hypothetical protein